MFGVADPDKLPLLTMPGSSAKSSVTEGANSSKKRGRDGIKELKMPKAVSEVLKYEKKGKTTEYTKTKTKSKDEGKP